MRTLVLSRPCVCQRRIALNSCTLYPPINQHAVLALRLSDTRRSLPPWRYGGSARVQRHQLATPNTAACLPALQEWLPVEALPELVAALDTPLPPGADGAERPRSRRRVGE
jgi:hypothetical protein